MYLIFQVYKMRYPAELKPRLAIVRYQHETRYLTSEHVIRLTEINSRTYILNSELAAFCFLVECEFSASEFCHIHWSLDVRFKVWI